MREHLAIEAVARFAMRRVATLAPRQLARGGPDDGAPAVMGGDVKTQIGAVHDQGPPDATAAKGSTCLWIGCARPIQGSGRIQRTQSAKLGMKPRSSTTCCSPISRTGTTRPVEMMMVAPKKRSSMKMPSA